MLKSHLCLIKENSNPTQLRSKDARVPCLGPCPFLSWPQSLEASTTNSLRFSIFEPSFQTRHHLIKGNTSENQFKWSRISRFLDSSRKKTSESCIVWSLKTNNTKFIKICLRPGCNANVTGRTESSSHPNYKYSYQIQKKTFLGPTPGTQFDGCSADQSKKLKAVWRTGPIVDIRIVRWLLLFVRFEPTFQKTWRKSNSSVHRLIHLFFHLHWSVLVTYVAALKSQKWNLWTSLSLRRTAGNST